MYVAVRPRGVYSPLGALTISLGPSSSGGSSSSSGGGGFLRRRRARGLRRPLVAPRGIRAPLVNVTHGVTALAPRSSSPISLTPGSTPTKPLSLYERLAQRLGTQSSSSSGGLLSVRDPDPYQDQGGGGGGGGGGGPEEGASPSAEDEEQAPKMASPVIPVLVVAGLALFAFMRKRSRSR